MNKIDVEKKLKYILKDLGELNIFNEKPQNFGDITLLRYGTSLISFEVLKKQGKDDYQIVLKNEDDKNISLNFENENDAQIEIAEFIFKNIVLMNAERAEFVNELYDRVKSKALEDNYIANELEKLFVRSKQFVKDEQFSDVERVIFQVLRKLKVSETPFEIHFFEKGVFPNSDYSGFLDKFKKDKIKLPSEISFLIGGSFSSEDVTGDEITIKLEEDATTLITQDNITYTEKIKLKDPDNLHRMVERNNVYDKFLKSVEAAVYVRNLQTKNENNSETNLKL